MRLIDADALKVHHGVNVGGNYGDLRAIVFKRDIDNAPTIEPVKTGKWIHIKKRLIRGGYVDASECSVCHKRIMPHLNPNYCPNCGAKMENPE